MCTKFFLVPETLTIDLLNVDLVVTDKKNLVNHALSILCEMMANFGTNDYQICCSLEDYDFIH